ncbi:hypothetical protein ACH5RR_032395 [Cinchona calisaya]|uniref:Uncharacterized protein n=1 Tax=Cinchona calisaya TaxID=153742 RepID=A0ABD2YI08_9GENT
MLPKLEVKIALEKATTVQERTNKQTQLREDVLRAKFDSTLAKKEEETKEKAFKLEQGEQYLGTINVNLKAAESKMKNENQGFWSSKKFIWSKSTDPNLVDLRRSSNKRTTDFVDQARAIAIAAQKEKREIQRTAMERLTQIEDRRGIWRA